MQHRSGMPCASPSRVCAGPVPGLRAGGDVLSGSWPLATREGAEVRLPAGAGCCVRVQLCYLLRAVEARESCLAGRPRSALALLVAQVLADDHDPTVTADHLALVADLLDARLDLHCLVSFRSGATGRPGTGLPMIRCRGSGVPSADAEGGWCETVSGSGRRCARGTGHTARVPPRPGPRGGSGCSAGASCPRCERALCDR